MPTAIFALRMNGKTAKDATTAGNVQTAREVKSYQTCRFYRHQVNAQYDSEDHCISFTVAYKKLYIIVVYCLIYYTLLHVQVRKHVCI